MRKRIHLYVFSLAVMLLPVPAVNAVSLSPIDSQVYAKVELFKGSIHFTDSFHVDTAGDYRAVLTDFAFPDPLGDTAFNITTATTSLGSLFGPGEVSFSALPGNYFISLFAVAAPAPTAMAQRFSRQSAQNASSRIARRYNRDADDDYGLRTVAARPGATSHDLTLGQYGIEITRVALATSVPTAVIPVPAAIWLFGSGLAALVAMGAARRRRG
ncbi:MAG: hypothetical protein J5I92_02280 [Thiogranum sp.]|nr:hypothetical protein [Thiogranum sp.]